MAWSIIFVRKSNLISDPIIVTIYKRPTAYFQNHFQNASGSAVVNIGFHQN